MRRHIGRVLLTVVIIVVVVLACAGPSEDTAPTDPTTTGATTTTTTATTTTTTTPTPTPTPTTAITTTTSPVTTAATTPDPDTTCDPTAILAIADRWIETARLGPGTNDANDDAWDIDPVAAAFQDRTNTASHVADTLALDCGVTAVNRTSAGHERLLVAAWTGERHALVIQATDAPASPFERLVRFELFIEQPHGEWLDPQRSWASTLSGGESIILVAHDLPIAHVAKSWWNGFEGWVDLPVTNAAERYAIDALEAVGARRVSVAEPAPPGSVVAQIQFNTAAGLHLVAVVAPAGEGWFDPLEPMFEGETLVEEINGVTVLFTITPPDHYAIASVGWSCDGYDWWFDAVYGGIDEYRELVEQLTDVRGCS